MAFGDFSSTKKDKTAENKDEKKDFVRWSNDYQKPQSSVFTLGDLYNWSPGKIADHIDELLVIRVHGNGQFGKNKIEGIECDWVVVDGKYTGLVREEKVIQSRAIVGLAKAAFERGEYILAGRVGKKKNPNGGNPMLVLEEPAEDEAVNATLAALTLGWVDGEAAFPEATNDEREQIDAAVERFRELIAQAAEDIVPVDEEAEEEFRKSRKKD